MPRRCSNTPGRGRDLPGGPDINQPKADHPDVSVFDALDSVLAALRELQLTPSSMAKFADLIERFTYFAADAHQAESLNQVDAETVDAYVSAKRSGHGELVAPSVATMHLRRSALRLYFRLARQLDLYDGDPTLDLTLPPRTTLPLRALTDDEMALCRSSSFRSMNDTAHPAAWALAEVGARTSEIPRIRLKDFDSTRGRVWLHGSNKAVPRWHRLTSWGLEQVRRRAAGVREQRRDALVYRGTGAAHSAQAAACIAVSDTLRRAGLHSEPDVRPGSVVAWAGLQVFKETGCIGEVARSLGLRSLDGAARMIGWDWQNSREPSDE